MLQRDSVLEQLNHDLTRLQEEFSVRKIGLFGSVARNQGHDQSDIDVLVELGEPTLDHYMDLKFYLEKLFNCSVDLVMIDTLKARIKPYIESEAVYAQGL